MEALIFDSTVVQVEPTNFPVHNTLEWVDITGITPSPKVGWSYNGAIFSPPPPPPLGQLKQVKRAEFIVEGVKRIGQQVPEWDSFERIEFLLSIANMLNIASMTAAQTLAKDILLYVKNTAISKVNATADQAALDAIDVTATDPFGDGTPWPT